MGHSQGLPGQNQEHLEGHFSPTREALARVALGPLKPHLDVVFCLKKHSPLIHANVARPATQRQRQRRTLLKPTRSHLANFYSKTQHHLESGCIGQSNTCEHTFPVDYLVKRMEYFYCLWRFIMKDKNICYLDTNRCAAFWQLKSL